METSRRDETADWLLPERARPPLLGELVERVDEALAIARASEAAVMTVGAAALDAAEQARRAADLAEQAGNRMLEITSADTVPEDDDDDLRDFSQRADQIGERLRALQRYPLSPAGQATAAVSS